LLQPSVHHDYSPNSNARHTPTSPRPTRGPGTYGTATGEMSCQHPLPTGPATCHCCWLASQYISPIDAVCRFASNALQQRDGLFQTRSCADCKGRRQQLGCVTHLNGLLYKQTFGCGVHRVWQASQLLRNAAASAAAAAAVELPAAFVWYSCRCLCRGFFLHMIKSFPLLLVEKQCSQIFFTAFFTFIVSDRGSVSRRRNHQQPQQQQQPPCDSCVS
jgi:hypothetical protein